MSLSARQEGDRKLKSARKFRARRAIQEICLQSQNLQSTCTVDCWTRSVKYKERKKENKSKERRTNYACSMQSYTTGILKDIGNFQIKVAR